VNLKYFPQKTANRIF